MASTNVCRLYLEVLDHSVLLYFNYLFFLCIALYINVSYRLHQFRITGAQRVPSKIDLKPFFTYIQNRYGLGDEWVANILIE